MARIILEGRIPSKKNKQYIRRIRGRPSIAMDEERKRQCEGLTWQMRKQWGNRKPVRHPRLTFSLWLRSGAQDRDNAITALLDCMVKAGVLEDDNVQRCNGEITIFPAIKVGMNGVEGAEIQVLS